MGVREQRLVSGKKNGGGNARKEDGLSKAGRPAVADRAWSDAYKNSVAKDRKDVPNPKREIFRKREGKHRRRLLASQAQFAGLISWLKGVEETGNGGKTGCCIGERRVGDLDVHKASSIIWS